LLRRPGQGPLLVFLHGFPSSSYDFRALLEELPGHDVLAFDCLGFGLSEKPRDHVYTLGWQADLAEDLVRRYAPERPIVLVAHDMGTSVATELLARDLEGRLGIDLRGALLFNGSIVVERASLTWVQRLLGSPLGPLASRLTSERLFRAQFARLFSSARPLTDAEATDQWSLITQGGGERIGHRLIGYVEERRRLAPRWHGAFHRWSGPLQLAWGLEDPVATTDVLEALRALRPGVPVTELPGVGHYPQIEAPRRLALSVRSLVGAAL
jgi:pimeloyl-ACP methyl ester carboxylesterase